VNEIVHGYLEKIISNAFAIAQQLPDPFEEVEQSINRNGNGSNDWDSENGNNIDQTGPSIPMRKKIIYQASR
jgi:hypothetical protein